MKPYLVQRSVWTPCPQTDGTGSGYRPDPAHSPVFILAPSPMAAARKAARWRSTHGGTPSVRLRVTSLGDVYPLEYAPYREYYVLLQVTVAGVSPVA